MSGLSSVVLYSSDINGVPSVLATPIVGEGVEIFSEEFVDGCCWLYLSLTLMKSLVVTGLCAGFTVGWLVVGRNF